MCFVPRERRGTPEHTPGTSVVDGRVHIRDENWTFALLGGRGEGALLRADCPDRSQRRKLRWASGPHPPAPSPDDAGDGEAYRQHQFFDRKGSSPWPIQTRADASENNADVAAGGGEIPAAALLLSRLARN